MPERRARLCFQDVLQERGRCLRRDLKPYDSIGISVRIDRFDFELDPKYIAQRPAEPRDSARMLVLDPVEDSLHDTTVADLPEFVEPGTVMVVNDTRVIRARLLGRKEKTGGKVEVLLIRRVESGEVDVDGRNLPMERWKAMGKTSRPLHHFPVRVVVGDPALVMVILEGRGDDGLLDVLVVRSDGGPIREAIERVGHVPLPPYIRRPDDATDAERYQTVYASRDGAVAAPTAGLHLTHRLFGVLGAKGVEIATVTLHVGPGTFQPVNVDDLDEHPMHEEWFEVPESTERAIAEARKRGSKVLAVGTTSVRALEAAADADRPGYVRASRGSTRILIQPGYQFRVVDSLLTNFHLPKSTLLALVSALAGRERILRAYRHAIEHDYRFYSYGDAMLIRGRVPSQGEEP